MQTDVFKDFTIDWHMNELSLLIIVYSSVEFLFLKNSNIFTEYRLYSKTNMKKRIIAKFNYTVLMNSPWKIN